VVAVSGSRALERYAWLGGTSYALDSVGDVFASFFMLGTGLLVFETRVLPRWLGWIAVATSPFFLLQGFGLGGLVSSFGLILDLIGFLLFLIFILASSVIGLTRGTPGTS
jgi:hypothetical protein